MAVWKVRKAGWPALHDRGPSEQRHVERVTSPRYLLAFWQVLVDACHSPPALSQSAFDLICDRSLEVPPLVDGLADGEVVDGALVDPELEPPVVPELPLEPLLSELLEPPDVVPEPLEPELPLVPCAAVMAGARPSARTSIANSKFFIASSVRVCRRRASRRYAVEASKLRTLDLSPASEPCHDAGVWG